MEERGIVKMNIDLDNDFDKVVAIKVVGVGGGGGNAVDHMCSSGMGSVEFVSVNTDIQVLRSSKASYKLHIGDKLTRGMGAGGDPEKGQKAAEESREEIAATLKGTDMVFITAGMGGGTGTGAAPIIAEIAHEMGILTIGVVTKPFEFEGKRRIRQAQEGITKLKEKVDSLLVIPNERLRAINPEITFFNAFAAADEVLMQAVQSISDLINIKGIVNLDFADVTSVMKDAGFAHMGIGRASGEGKAEKAAKEAITSPLLETSINGARGVIVNFLVPPSIDLKDINNASAMIHDAASEEVNLIWGVAFDENLDDEIRITVIATDFEHESGYSIPTTPAKVEQHSPVAAPAPAAPAPVTVPTPAAPAPAPAPVAEPQPPASIAASLSALGDEDDFSDSGNDGMDEFDLSDIIKMLNNR